MLIPKWSNKLSTSYVQLLLILGTATFRVHYNTEAELFACCSLLFSHCSLLFARCSLVFARCSLLCARCSLPFARWLLLFARFSLVFAHCSLFFTHCSLLFARRSILFARCSLFFRSNYCEITLPRTAKRRFHYDETPLFLDCGFQSFLKIQNHFTFHNFTFS